MLSEPSPYVPAPIDTGSVALDPGMVPLLEKLAENAHEVWAKGRVDDGWSWGPKREDDARHHPCLISYSLLPDAEKAYDRRVVGEGRRSNGDGDPSCCLVRAGAVGADDAAAARVRATGYRVSADGATLAIISRLLESGDVRVYVDRVFELHEASDAHQTLETGHTRGKIVLKVSDG